jgi:hypothetical protein
MLDIVHPNEPAAITALVYKRFYFMPSNIDPTACLAFITIVVRIAHVGGAD